MGETVMTTRTVTLADVGIGPTDVPAGVVAMFNDARVVRVRWYPHRWYPNSYRYPAPAEGMSFTRGEDGGIVGAVWTYDRCRSNGEGPTFVAFSARGGVLASVW